MQPVDNIRIKEMRPLIMPGELIRQIPINERAASTVLNTRQEIVDILEGKSHRLFVIIGPCSIHDTDAALEYAQKLKQARAEFGEELLIVMRTYFEKPRTTTGWKGLINDPLLDNSFDINLGLRTARQLLLDINTMRVPTSGEFLDTTIPQYISDLIAWAAIGARTTESQIHRQLTSGLSMPVGFKNGTTGNIQIAVDAVCAAKAPHHFLGVTKEGQAAIVGTRGNPNCHIILRGSSDTTNYDQASVTEALALLNKAKTTPRLMIDCSHGNSRKDHKKQAEVVKSITQQIEAGSEAICGVMIESNLVEGKQTFTPGKPLNYGQSITDACIDWNESLDVLGQLSTVIKKRKITHG